MQWGVIGSVSQRTVNEVSSATMQPAYSNPPFSLRLGHASALTIHRIVIHYLVAAALPATTKGNCYLAAARSQIGSNSPPDCYSLPICRYATLVESYAQVQTQTLKKDEKAVEKSW